MELLVQADPIPSRRPLRFNNLDVIRLFLALSVLVFHVQLAANMGLKGLFWAVPSFLTISGFVVLQSYERSRDFLHFAWKRLLRVLPAMVVSLVLVFALFGSWGVHSTLLNYASLGLTKIGGANPPIWSLACEEIFYVVLAVLFTIGCYKRPAVIWALFGVSLIIALMVAPTGIERFQRLALLGPAFFGGNLLYLYRDRILSWNQWIPTAALLATGGIYAFTPIHDAPILLRTLHLLAFSLSLTWFGFAGPQITWRPKWDLSYGIYIYGFPILRYLNEHAGIHAFVPLLASNLALTVILAMASWFLVERHAIGFKDWTPEKASGILGPRWTTASQVQS